MTPDHTKYIIIFDYENNLISIQLYTYYILYFFLNFRITFLCVKTFKSAVKPKVEYKFTNNNNSNNNNKVN